MQRGLDVLAGLLAQEKKFKELEKIISPNISVSEYGPELWIAMAYYFYASRKNSKAIYFAHKVCTKLLYKLILVN